ncbi:Polygalacturonase [Vitis vinifera]|uniref:Polygalacturonase n=1 Tax=Vitis vinifera TaxID=29760 RepID=A0A438EGY5_VITVI|nr:Polygalacturonase [Vitis vinifera]
MRGCSSFGSHCNCTRGQPNTDGIHVTDTQNIQISSSVIGTGDDCISIVSGTQNLQATGITCGPGHGISIGSLGSGNSEAHVSDITVNGATLSGTTNGVRIKTWPGGSGSASNIKFQNIEMHNVKNPIIIDQKYCDGDKPCKSQSRAVQVQNVLYQNIKGTSSSSEAIQLDCSDKFPCQGIVLQDIDIEIGGEKQPKLCATMPK